jgi:hypothetical protein
MTTSDSNVNIGDKRKATTNSTTDSTSATKNDEEKQGKDLVEKKQTTLDDIVHSEKDNQPTESKSEDKEEERPAKKTKTEESSTEVEEKDEDEVKEREEKVKEREEKVKEKEEKVDKDIEMNSSPLKSKSTTEYEKPTTSTSNPESNEKTTTDVEAPQSDQTPSETPVQTPATTNMPSKPVGNGNGTEEETIPGDEAHLDHPENWTTGGDPATEKQKGFLKVLEKQKGVPVGDLGGIGKSEASEKIDELKNMCEYSHHLERS